VIGGWALPAYGRTRFTKDVDVFFEPTTANAKRLVKALAEVGYDGISDVPLEIVLSKKILMRDYVLQADSHPSVKGASFKEAWKNKVETNIEGQKVFVPSLDNLIEMKEAAGRPVDLLDLEYLYEVRERSREKSSNRKKTKPRTTRKRSDNRSRNL
jgi:hypothetical protein